MASSELLKIQNFLPAVVKNNRSMGYYIEYFIYDPVEELMLRKRIRVQKLVKRYKSKRDQQLAAQQVADELNAKLAGGWSPLHESDDSRLYTPIAELRDKFLTAKKREGCRDTTLVNYTSMTKLFLLWCESTGRGRKFSGTFLKADGVCYMDSIMEKGNSNRSYNNTFKALHSFFQWAMDHCYCKENPFSNIKALPKAHKKRVLVDAKTRSAISTYFSENKPLMNIVCKLVYYSALRPLEIQKLHIRDIDTVHHCVVVPEEVAKNGKVRCATLPPDVLEELLPIVAKSEGDWFLFGEGNMEPAPRAINKGYFRKQWDKMRKALDLPEEMQLYSLRDTGLTDLLHAGVDQLTVQHHADHSSLAMQNIYTNHFDAGLNEKIYKAKVLF